MDEIAATRTAEGESSHLVVLGQGWTKPTHPTDFLPGLRDRDDGGGRGKKRGRLEETSD